MAQKYSALKLILKVTLLAFAASCIEFPVTSMARPSKKRASKQAHNSDSSDVSQDEDSIQIHVEAPKRKGNKQNVNEEDGFNSERSYRYGNEELEVDPD